MKRIRVAVTGISSAERPGPGAAIALSLKEDPTLDVEIVGLCCEAEGSGSCAHWVADASCVMPVPHGDGDAYLNRLLEIKASFGLDLIIPALDSELPFFIQHAAKLAEFGIQTFVPTRHHYSLRRRDMLESVARTIGVKTPRTQVVRTPEHLDQAVAELGLPLMLKGLYQKAYCARTVEEARLRFNELGAEWGLPVVVQEVLGGAELYVVGLGDGNGAALGVLGFRKVVISEEEGLWTGVAYQHDKLLRTAADFIAQSDWRGPFEMACRVVNDEIYLVDLHPRFPVWSHVAVSMGTNLAARLAQCAVEQAENPHADFEAGRHFLKACAVLQPVAWE